MKSLSGVDLKRFLREYRRHNQADHDIAALLHSVEYPYNVGAIFRLADGAGITRLILSGITPVPPNPTIKKVGRSKDRNVPWSYEKDPQRAIAELRTEGYRIIAVELTDEAIAYNEHIYAQKVCRRRKRGSRGDEGCAIALRYVRFYPHVWEGPLAQR